MTENKFSSQDMNPKRAAQEITNTTVDDESPTKEVGVTSLSKKKQKQH